MSTQNKNTREDQEQPTQRTEQAPPAPYRGKKPYTSPVLTVHGTVADLTKTGAGTLPDTSGFGSRT